MKFKYVIIGLLFLFLIEMPFFSILGVEHVLANAEPDGHAHSEFDLCDWLQIQTTGSLTFHVNMLRPLPFSLHDTVFQGAVVVNQQPSTGSVANSELWYHQPFSEEILMPTISFKGRHFQRDMILQSLRWYLAYALSYRDIEEMMAERGFSVDHSTINRWVLHYSPQLDATFRHKKKRVGMRWRMDETYIKVKGEWTYYYRAVDKQGQTIDFLLTATRDRQAARRFFKKAIKHNRNPSLVNIDQSGANTAGLKLVNRDNNTRIKIRQCKYLNNMIEQDHRRIKRLTRPMLGFKNFYAAQRTLSGIEVMAMIKKGQMKMQASQEQTCAQMFYSLAA